MTARSDGGDEATPRVEGALLRALADDPPFGMVMADSPRGTVTFANRRAEVIWGLDGLARRLGRGERVAFDELVDACAAAAIDGSSLSTRLRRNDLAPDDFELALRDGRTVRWVVSLTRDERGRALGLLHITEDITDRKRAEQAGQSALARMQRSEAEFRHLIERVPDGVVVMREGRFLYANVAAARILGYDSPTELVGLHFSSIITPEEVPESTARIERMSASEAPMAERVMVRRDGSTIYAETVGFTTQFDGAPATLVIAKDVTEQKRIQARVLQAERLASVGTLAAGVAHEINNPLAYLLLNLEQIRRQIVRLGADRTAPPPADLLTLLDQSREGAERVRNIVRDLKTFSRADDVRSVAVDVRTVLESTIQMTASEVQHRARLVRDYRDVPTVHANESRLAQVFLNLLLNAAQSIPEGNSSENEIRIVVRPEGGDHIAIEVRDTGVGIAPEARARIFDPFFTTKAVGEGTGLGLSVCLGIVEALGGTITADSLPVRGTAFRVVLPAWHHASERAPLSTPATDAPRLRILVVDDEPSVARAFAGALDAHETTVATGGREALARLRERPFDVVFCDVMMPDVSGIEVFEQTQRDDPETAQRFVFMTGGAFVDRARTFLASVPNVCIDKPFDWSAVQRLLARTTRR